MSLHFDKRCKKDFLELMNMLDLSDDEDFPSELKSEYKIKKKLGNGAFGEVYLIKQKQTGEQYALKIQPMSDDQNGSMVTEAKVMTRLHHSNLTRLHDYYESLEKSFIVMDYMKGGSLSDRLKQANFLESKLGKFYFYQMCKGLKYLHSKNIAHRDLKPDNMLLASDSEKTLLKISDFGLSKNKHYMGTKCGTKIYLAPEVLSPNKNLYNKQCDVWSLGVVLFECLSGTFPFNSEKSILMGDFDLNNSRWRNKSDNAKSLIKKILVVDPKRRYDVHEILDSRWLNDEKIKRDVEIVRSKYC